MINFIPFYKRKDFDDGVEEPEEVKHFNSFSVSTFILDIL